MKVIKCELCGSNDFKKVNGEYECQFCHTKYSPEDAKKMMIEGTVEVTGTVNIDVSDKQKNYEKLAERSFKDKLYDQAYNYYEKLLEMDSDNWEYVYKKGVCAAWQSTLANFRVDETIKACKNAFNIIEIQNIELENKEKVCYQMADDINKVCVAFCALAQNHYNEFWELESAAPDYWGHLQQLIDCEEYAKEIIKEYIANDETKDLYLVILKNLVTYLCEICASRKYKSGYNQYGATYGWIWYKNELRAPLIEKYDNYVLEIKKLEPEYVAPVMQKQAKAGCYVATCVYGSYDCPQVWTLRRYRDYCLAETWYGRLFIKTYYAISPTIVKLFGKTKWFKSIWKIKLDKMVKKLQDEGYSAKPYNDINWKC
ncbi:MAG: CFI-box-CTERM domain-containing protein [Clostridia bacterium]|nr:CFI-box-CTERM domain-containing protein [Clostridia bacterium]